jgi:membrane protein implicated in regulation of membrane protease activity
MAMHLVALAWIYVALMMSVAEATAPQGTLLGAFITFLLYGVLPLSIVLYLMATPMRRSARRRAEAKARQRSAADPDGGGHAAGDAITPVREEP